MSISGRYSLYIKHQYWVCSLFVGLRVVEQNLLHADDNVLLAPAIAFDVLFVWYR